MRKKRPKLKSCILLLAIIPLTLFSVNYITQAMEYFSGSESHLAGFWNVRWWLYPHILGGVVALIIGPFQFVSKLGDSFHRLHKKLGYGYVSGILISSICSIYLALTHAFELHWTWSFSLLFLAFVWIVTTAMAVFTIRQKLVIDHQKWMVRSYLVTLAFVTHRWLVDLPFLVEMGNFIERAPTTIWVAWSVPLLLCEVIFQITSSKKAIQINR
jgi:uncharacterized membrane protein